MVKQRTLAEAKAGLSECIREVEHGAAVVITRHGKPVAARVRPEALERRERLRAAGPPGGRASVAGGWKGSEELAALLERPPRTRGRRSPSPR